MPVIPESSDFPSAPQKGNESGKTQPGDQNPALAAFSSKGPQIPNPNDLPPKASREEIEARMKELNKPSN
ncbi:unnamed protein product [Penicillium salamii]|uniref:Uncharacterized protein n=1 Tax=Penicillium salamii TaxID=1612424 RepID=A0A9W4K031_9EURO|nr:unnamed protein product [Penicillium salamii]CAG8413762.1 unnamed protein product [Penicillium salamii]CAG8428923.1 unnamed protein product [Penicillium salamii]